MDRKNGINNYAEKLNISLVDSNLSDDDAEDFLGHDNEYAAGETVEMFHYISNTWYMFLIEGIIQF